MDKLSLHGNQELRTAAVLLDMEKTFARVRHKSLFYKLHQSGIPTNLSILIDYFPIDWRSILGSGKKTYYLATIQSLWGSVWINLIVSFKLQVYIMH